MFTWLAVAAVGVLTQDSALIAFGIVMNGIAWFIGDYFSKGWQS